MRSWLSKNRHVYWLLGLIALALAYFLTQHLGLRYHVVHLPLDDRIPFCPVFVVFYILWYFYVLWMVANVLYWCGWIAKRVLKAEKSEKADLLAQKYLLRYFAVTGALLAAVVLFGNGQSTTSYRAYRMWRNGWAQAYGAGWEERIAVLKDDSVKNPVFRPLNYVELLMYTDLQPENGYVWVNTACAEYYGKESVTVVAGTTGE